MGFVEGAVVVINKQYAFAKKWVIGRQQSGEFGVLYLFANAFSDTFTDRRILFFVVQHCKRE